MSEEMTEEATEQLEPWRVLMRDVSEMMKEALALAEEILNAQYVEYLDVFAVPELTIANEAVIRMAVSIFDATVQAEGTRRMIEAQREMNIGAQITGTPKIVTITPDGRPIKG